MRAALKRGVGGELYAERGGGSKLRRGGCEGCFVYMSWLVGAFDFVIVVSSWKIESYELCVILTTTLEVCPLGNHTDKWHDI